MKRVGVLAVLSALVIAAIAAPSAGAATKPTQVDATLLRGGDFAVAAGFLDSSSDACIKNRPVALIRVRRAGKRGVSEPAKPVDTAKTSRRGGFGLIGTLTPSTGGFILEAPRYKPSRNLTCKRAFAPLPLEEE